MDPLPQDIAQLKLRYKLLLAEISSRETHPTAGARSYYVGLATKIAEFTAKLYGNVDIIVGPPFSHFSSMSALHHPSHAVRYALLGTRGARLPIVCLQSGVVPGSRRFRPELSGKNAAQCTAISTSLWIISRAFSSSASITPHEPHAQCNMPNSVLVLIGC